MGYCGGGDTLTQVELTFPTLETAVHYAERQGLTYVVQGDPRSRQLAEARREGGGRQEFSDMVLEKLGLAAPFPLMAQPRNVRGAPEDLLPWRP